MTVTLPRRRKTSHTIRCLLALNSKASLFRLLAFFVLPTPAHASYCETTRWLTVEDRKPGEPIINWRLIRFLFSILQLLFCIFDDRCDLFASNCTERDE